MKLLRLCNELGQGTRAAMSYRADHGYLPESIGGTVNVAHREGVIRDVDLLIATDDWLAVLYRAGWHAASFQDEQWMPGGRDCSLRVYSDLWLRIWCSSVR